MDKITQNARIDKVIDAVTKEKNFNWGGLGSCVIAITVKRVLKRKWNDTGWYNREEHFINVSRYLNITFGQSRELYFGYRQARDINCFERKTEKDLAIEMLNKLKRKS